MNNNYETKPAVAPLTKDQRQRVECMTFVRSLWTEDQPWQANAARKHRLARDLDVEDVLTLTHYLYAGPPQVES